MKRSPTLGIRALRDHASAAVRRVQQGEVLTITDRNRPVARLVPIPATPDEAVMHALVAKGIVSWSGGKPTGSSRRPRLRRGASVASAVIRDRR